MNKATIVAILTVIAAVIAAIQSNNMLPQYAIYIALAGTIITAILTQLKDNQVKQLKAKLSRFNQK